MKKLLVLLTAVFMCAAFTSSASAAFIPADIVFIFDESGSMAPDQANVITNLGIFTGAMTAAGIDAKYGLVGFGALDLAPNIRLVTDLTTAGGLATALTALTAQPTAWYEPGFEATKYAVDNISWRAGAVSNLIMITDEDSDGTEGGADAALYAQNSLWNGIVNLGDTSSPAGDYATLASNHGGTLFDIKDFQADPAGFLTSFSEIKIKEIKKKAEIPEPASLSLLSIGLLGLLGLKKRRRS